MFIFIINTNKNTTNYYEVVKELDCREGERERGREREREREGGGS